MKSRAALILAVVIGMFVSSSVYAQIGQGRLSGTVTDSQGAVMPGVTVTVTSPSLIGAQSTVTEANGKFLFPSLPSGTYKLNFELSGFQKVNRENINVVTGQTISADVQLPLASLAESVTVTGASPVVDVTTTKVGTNLKGEALTAVPNSTDAWGALSEAPGVRMQGFDVGGSHKSQQSATRSSASRTSRVLSPMVWITPKASAAPATTRITTRTKKCRSARSAATSR